MVWIVSFYDGNITAQEYTPNALYTGCSSVQNDIEEDNEILKNLLKLKLFSVMTVNYLVVLDR